MLTAQSGTLPTLTPEAAIASAIAAEDCAWTVVTRKTAASTAQEKDRIVVTLESIMFSFT